MSRMRLATNPDRYPTASMIIEHDGPVKTLENPFGCPSLNLRRHKVGPSQVFLKVQMGSLPGIAAPRALIRPVHALVAGHERVQVESRLDDGQ